MDIDLRITIDQNPADSRPGGLDEAEATIMLEDEIRDQVFESAPLMVRSVVVLRNDGFGNLVPDPDTKVER